MIQQPADPIDYYGSHRDNLRSFGGYAPNMPVSSATLSAGRMRPPMETSTHRRDFIPHCLSTPEQTTGKNVYLGRSGFSSNKALHLPSTLDVMRANRAQASEFYSGNSRLSPDTCTVPTSLRNEHGESFRGIESVNKPCGTANYLATHYWMNSPGSRDSGFTSGYNSINPVYWRQHEPLMDQLGRNPPEIRSNAASVSQTDYRPYANVNYESAPIQGILQTRLTKGTGFTTSKELHPCFLPEPCVYGNHTPSYMGDPSRYNTSYNIDFKARAMSTDTSGCQIVGKGMPLKLMVEQSPDFSLGCGPPRTFVSETRDRYLNHWPLEAQRNFGLAFPVGSTSSSGFVHSVKKHGVRDRPCNFGIQDSIDTSPQRYNPWPKFYLGHRTMIDRSYRPNPLVSGIDYAITTSLPTTGNNSEVFLY